MPFSPFDNFRAALDSSSGPAAEEHSGVRIDASRLERCGVPEIVYCRGKSLDSIVTACTRLAVANGRVLATRCEPASADLAEQALVAGGLTIERHPEARAFVVAQADASPPETGGLVGLLTAGTSDWPVAAEAKLVAEEAGCEMLVYRDTGVAGLHRLVKPLEALIERDVDVIIVAAGMDGVLPSVVAGLVAVPIIGLPTSTGYGHGGQGEGALTTMLQSCAPGIAVVNIDNGVGAGAMAALIARRAHLLRNRQSDPVPAREPA